jgi:hypothetical protein
LAASKRISIILIFWMLVNEPAKGWGHESGREGSRSLIAQEAMKWTGMVHEIMV